MIIIFRSPFSSPRLEYIVSWIVEERMGLTVHFDKEHNLHPPVAEHLVISYDRKVDSSADINIWSDQLLTLSSIIAVDTDVHHDCDLPYFFSVKDKNLEFDLPFDLFAMSFYLLSRYEEYLPHTSDQHGRYMSTQSIAVKEGFIQMPLVDLWIEKLKDIITSKSTKAFFLHSSFFIRPTIDIDLPFAYRQKSMKNIAAFIRDVLILKWSNAIKRFDLAIRGQDPFDTYDYLIDRLSSNKDTLFFLLCHYKMPFDENHLVNDKLFSTLVKRLSHHFKMGIHPSYSSDSQANTISQELSVLQNIIGSDIHLSRQHFLKISTPETFRSLIVAGIMEDHSLMYADQIGFRASTCFPFSWFDLESNQATDLRLYSPCVMDVTLKDYMNLSPEVAITEIRNIKKTVQQVGGPFEFIWHNSSFSSLHGWEGWREVFEELNKDY
jgi:hypothetical protein